jgi:hypothetical protein
MMASRVPAAGLMDAMPAARTVEYALVEDAVNAPS